MSRKIAFIDTESNVLESLKWVFKEEPYHLYTFSNPLEALKTIEAEEFAVVVADQHTREMGGIEFFQRVKEQQPNTVCIIMTALSDTCLATDAVDRKNIYHIIFKPWDNDELKILIKDAVTYYENITRQTPYNSINR
jgi:DNA-binding NtrC family response regulator